MNIFIVTDNKWWLEKVENLFNEKGLSASFFCSPKGESLFKEEIKSERIKSLDVKHSVEFITENFDLGFSFHCKQVFPKELVEKVRCINIHPGLNPYNRGWFPQVFSIINRKPLGATIHLMDCDVDHGEIICQDVIEIHEWDTSKSVYGRVLDAEYNLFVKCFDLLVSGAYYKEEMRVEGNYNSIQDYKDLLEIDLDKKVTMREAIDYLRAMTHPPYKNSFFRTKNGEAVYVSLNIERLEL